MATKTETKVISFDLERETKNTVRYAEDAPVPAVGTLYVQKHAVVKADGTFPAKLSITIAYDA